MNNYEPKVTKRLEAVDTTLTMSICCESSRGITIMVDKDDLAQGRKQRCTACLMRLKVRQGINQ